MKLYQIVSLGFFIIALSSSFQEQELSEPLKPNILIILTDDQGSLDLNSYGAIDLHTPNLDRLAKEGTRFTQFYAVAPVCSPSRAGLLTGKFNYNAGLYGNVQIPGSDPEFLSGLPTEEITMAEAFKEGGYRTALIGKWHLGHSPEKLPNGQGFDYFFGHQYGCIDNYSHFFMWDGPNRHDLYQNETEIYRNGQFFGDLMVEEVKTFASKDTGNPFFLYWAINMPHYPYQGKTKWLDYYKQLETPRKEYAAFLSTMDEMVGKVLKHLEDTNQLDNTIIVFQSDHGHSVEQRAYFGGGFAGPYHGAKFSMLEGGIRVPAIIRYPKVIPSNTVRDQMAGSIDWFPTLLDISGTKMPDGNTIDGKSLLPIIKDAKAQSPNEVLHWATGNPKGKNTPWAVRKGDWKLIGNPSDPEGELKFVAGDSLYLVNLAVDVTESTNLGKENPKKLKELLTLHNTWLKSVFESTKKN